MVSQSVDMPLSFEAIDDAYFLPKRCIKCDVPKAFGKKPLQYNDILSAIHTPNHPSLIFIFVN